MHVHRTETKESRWPSKMLWHATMSLDCFITGPDDAMDWSSSSRRSRIPPVEATQITGATLAAGAATTWPPAGTVAERGSTAGAWTGPVRHSETLSLADRLAGVSSP